MKNITEKFGRGTETQGRALIQVRDGSTSKVVQEVRSKNLLFDSGLAAQANGIGYARLMRQVKLGSGSTQPNSYYDGSITFTQVGTTLTASGVFFTSAMIGGVFKWNTGGTGGDEMYITAVGSSVSATVSQSATVGTGAAATVWQVQQTSLQTALPTLGFLTSATYGVVATGASISGNVLTLIREFVFPVETVNYTVNELGYCNLEGGGTVLGRFDISGTPVTVSTSQFLVVTLTFTFAVSPSAPATVGNVGTNVDTSGTAMIMCWDNQSLQNNGSQVDIQSSVAVHDFLDGFGQLSLGFLAATQSLPGSIPTPTLVNGQCNTVTNLSTIYQTNSGSIAAGAAQTVVNSSGTCSLGGACAGGKAVNIAAVTISFSITTAGQVVEALVFGVEPNGGQVTNNFVLNLTTPVTLPTGTLAGSFTFTNTFGRELSN